MSRQLDYPVEACSQAVTLGYNMFRDFFECIEEYNEQVKPLHHYQLMIICPDCGKGVAYLGRCPKCGGASWCPAGKTGLVQREVEDHLRRRSGVTGGAGA